MFGSIGFGELMVIFLVILLVFGAKRVPEIARSLGKSIHEFKKGVNSTMSEIQDSLDAPPEPILKDGSNRASNPVTAPKRTKKAA